MLQPFDRGSYIGMDTAADNGFIINVKIFFKDGLESRADPIDNRAQVGGSMRILHRKLLQRRNDRAAVAMTKHHYQARTKLLSGVFDAADL